MNAGLLDGQKRAAFLNFLGWGKHDIEKKYFFAGSNHFKR